MRRFFEYISIFNPYSNVISTISFHVLTNWNNTTHTYARTERERERERERGERETEREERERGGRLRERRERDEEKDRHLYHIASKMPKFEHCR